MEKLYEIQKEVEEKCKRNVLLCALQGSQNYNLNDEKSDIDVKVFVMPNFDDFYNCKKISKTYDTKYGKVEVKDIRLLPELIKKMNLTYLEVLATKYFIVDEDFYFIFKEMQKHLQEVIDSRKKPFFRAILGSIQCEMKSLVQTDGTYKTKDFGHILRLYEMLKKMATNGCSFEEALYNEGEKRKHLLKAKREVLFETEIAKQEVENIYNEIKNFIILNEKTNECICNDETINKYFQEPIKGYIYDNYKYYF